MNMHKIYHKTEVAVKIQKDIKELNSFQGLKDRIVKKVRKASSVLLL